MTKLAPRKIGGLMMGAWFLATAFGNKLAGWVASYFDIIPVSRLFFLVFITIDEHTTKDVRSSAQNVFNLIIFGVGVILGNWFSGWLGRRSTRWRGRKGRHRRRGGWGGRGRRQRDRNGRGGRR